MFWEDGSPCWEGTKMQDGKRNPQGVEWMWMKGKRMVSLLQIYDIGKQETMLRWLLLRDFGRHKTYPFSWDMEKEEDWQDSYTMVQRGACVHYDEMVFFLPLIVLPSHICYGGSMEEQQTFLLLGLYSDVAGVGGGTSIVKRDCSLALDAQEIHSLWEGLYMCSSMMSRAFDKIHVKELSFEMKVALLHSPTTLSLQSWVYLLKCFQNQFTSDVPWRHVGDEDEGVMDGSILYYILIFLAWVHKHKEGHLHAEFMDPPFMHSYAYSLLMEESTWEGILMDVYQHMVKCIAQEMMIWLAQPLPYAVAVRENFHLSHFNSKTGVHDEGGKYLLNVFHSLIFLSSI